MKRNTIKWLLVVLGALLLIGSLIADFVWAASYPGFHTEQIIGIVLGAVVLLVGLLLPK
jgi:peptidoglycan/LPS O-acetylase OafA/YrhL